MRKKLALLAFAVILAIGSVAVKPASAITCPPRTHLVLCPLHGAFCCPNVSPCVC